MAFVKKPLCDLCSRNGENHVMRSMPFCKKQLYVHVYVLSSVCSAMRLAHDKVYQTILIHDMRMEEKNNSAVFIIRRLHHLLQVWVMSSAICGPQNCVSQNSTLCIGFILTTTLVIHNHDQFHTDLPDKYLMEYLYVDFA